MVRRYSFFLQRTCSFPYLFALRRYFHLRQMCGFCLAIARTLTQLAGFCRACQLFYGVFLRRVVFAPKMRSVRNASRCLFVTSIQGTMGVLSLSKTGVSLLALSSFLFPRENLIQGTVSYLCVSRDINVHRCFKSAHINQFSSSKHTQVILPRLQCLIPGAGSRRVTRVSPFPEAELPLLDLFS